MYNSRRVFVLLWVLFRLALGGCLRRLFVFFTFFLLSIRNRRCRCRVRCLVRRPLHHLHRCRRPRP